VSDRYVTTIEGAGESVVVFDRGPYRCLRMADNQELIQGYQHRYRRLDFRSEYLHSHLAATLALPNPSRALCLGLGVGAIPQLLSNLYPQIEITAVELNETVYRAASTYFGLNRLRNLDVKISCASTFVGAPSQGRYDLIFVDCYDAIGIPDACSSRAYVKNIMTLLAENGLIVVNLLPGRRFVDTMFALWVDYSTDAVVIPGVVKSNRTLICSKHILPERAQLMPRLQSRVLPPMPFDVRAPWQRMSKADRYLGRW
tara:strand:+ start:1457 stop:2227 length:771 start_codon:yes stop_codon:yes gene_type:complete